MKIQQFQGGLSTRLAPQFLEVNEGVVYENVDNTVGVLAPISQPLATTINLLPFHTWYDFGQEWIDSDIKRDYIEYKRKLYWTDRVSTPQVYDGTNTFNLGIVPPVELTNVTERRIEELAEVSFEVTLNVGTLPNEDTYYVIVNADSAYHTNDLAILVDTRTQLIQATTRNLRRFKTIAKTITPDVRTVAISKVAGLAYGTTGVEVYRLYEGTYYLVGTLLNDTQSVIDDVNDISANAVLDDDKLFPLQGVYQYEMTFYNSTTGVESGPSPVSAEYDFSTGGTLTFNSLPVSSDAQVDKKRLYRVGGGLTAFTLVVELDNATTVYLDNVKDTETVGLLLPSAIAEQAPTGLAYLSEAYAMLFGAEGSLLRFTPVGDPESWPETYFLTFDADITGIAAVSNGVLVFTKFKTHLVTGTGPASLSSQLLTSDQGCLAYESVQVIGGAALWVSTDGICTSSGNQVQVVSKNKLGKIALDVVDSVVFDEAYYALESNGSILSFDFAYGKIYKRLAMDIASLAIANDVLYGIRDGVLQEVYGSDEPATLKYKSPRFIEGSVTGNKVYKKVHIYHKGDIIVNILINNNLVVTGKLLSGTGSTTIKVPQELQRGFFIQFEFEGEGTVHEIEYEVGQPTSTK
tara:strand:+ start:8251 stop:10149 length:1899 start_codon:yes stop_codon:yes gene_type:complete